MRWWGIGESSYQQRVKLLRTDHVEATGTGIAVDIDGLIAPHMAAALSALDGPAGLLGGMGRYHLGLVDRHFSPVAGGQLDRGKRIRPSIAVLCCAAAGGRPEEAAPLAAAIELLHNFTLVHDDIQDHSPTRRHRPTVWTLWGNAQAINAGDALFAAAHLALFRLRHESTPAELVLNLADAFDRMTIEIVAGQVSDLQFESRSDVTPGEYLRMIAGKTAAIVRFSAWAGAMLGGASEAIASRFAEFGLALGLGFQIQDDLLGVWGSTAQTGKAEADDIRRRKKSLPILLLRAVADDESIAQIDRLYANGEIDPRGIESMLGLLDRFEIRRTVEQHVRSYHDDAARALAAACPSDEDRARLALARLIESLASRSS